MFSRALLLLSCLAFLAACKSTTSSQQVDPTKAVLSLQKNPCFGKCPFYTLTIFADGRMEYDGKRFVEKFGLHEKRLSQKQYDAVVGAFEKADFFSFDDDYPSTLPDLPVTVIRYAPAEVTKTVSGNINRPQMVKGLEQLLVSIAESDGWTLLSVPELNLPDHVILDELIISVKPYTNIRDWMKKYPDWNLELLKEIGRDKNLYLLKYDAPGLKPSQVIHRLLMDEDVKVAEFNKEVKGRN